MSAILEIDHLQEKVNKASLSLREEIGVAYWRGQSLPACMLDILAPAGYHQVQLIADTLGMDFDEQFSNEYEWERFHKEVTALKGKVEGELQGTFQLPEGISLCLGFDREGNFGLFLRSEERRFHGQPQGMN